MATLAEDEEDQKLFSRLSFSTSSNSLSEGLTIPTRQIKRRVNDYVKVRPQSISTTTEAAEEDIATSNSNASEVVTTAAVIEHHETAL